MIDHETIALDAELSELNELRARLDAAIADNQTLHEQLARWQKYARTWERRARNERNDQ